MYFDDIQKLITFVSERYSEPQVWWGKKHFKIRSAEIWGCETAIMRCLNSTRNPLDILEEYYLELLIDIRGFANRPEIQIYFKHASIAVKNLLAKL